jgi:hypothetical protein
VPETSPAAGQKTQLTLTRFKVNTAGTSDVETQFTFTAMVNPSEFTHDHSITYNTSDPLGKNGAEVKFSGINAEKLRFSMVLDGTGVVPSAGPSGQRKDVKTLVAELKEVVCHYVPGEHEPSHVQVLWGTLIFFGRMDSMSIKYTLFKPSGEPLRAKADLSFVSSMSKKEIELLANRSSPDLSHSVLVVAGDTLPLLCHRIYKDASYYPEVARFNKLGDFRRLVPGLRLHFPPLG